MNLQTLRYVVTIEQTGSLSKASQYLYVSQSTLSRSVKELEEQRKKAVKAGDQDADGFQQLDHFLNGRFLCAVVLFAAVLDFRQGFYPAFFQQCVYCTIKCACRKIDSAI